MITQQSFYLADLFINPSELSLSTADGVETSIQQKPMEVLAYLAQRHPALVSRQELIDSVWAGNSYVGEKALTNAIWQLRTVLQQLAEAELINTVRKKGYRLAVAPVFQAAHKPAPSAAEPATKAGNVRQRRLLWPVVGAALFSLLAILLYTNMSLLAGDDAPQIVSLTKGNGRAMFPALSPDERYLVFSWRKFEMASNLYLMDLQNTTKAPRQLTFSADDESRPLWSKDGRHIYFSSKTAIYGECYIMQLDTVTLASQRLAACNRHSTVYMDISADGRYLAFSGRLQPDGASLYQLDLQNPEAEPQAVPCQANCEYRVRDMAFSPDGRYLALTRRAHRLSEEIYLHDLATGQEQKLTSGDEDIMGLAWHPDAERLLFSAFKHGKRQGFILNVTDKQLQPLALDDFAWPSRIMANGDVFYHSNNNVPQLGYLPLNQGVTGAIFPLTAADARYESPHYSKAQHALAYVSNESGYMEIWKADLNMENRQQLTQLHGMVKYPQWSNNGRYIAFVARFPNEEEDKLMLLEVKTGKLSQLKTGALWHGKISWWFDDSAVIFSHNNNLFSIDTHSFEVSQLTFKGGVWGQILAADRFYFSKGRNRGLWQLMPDGSEKQLLPGNIFSSRTAWTVAERGIYFLQQKPGQLLVSYYDTDSSKLHDLILLPPDLLHLLSVISFDEENQRLLFELSMHPRADIQKLSHPLLH